MHSDTAREKAVLEDVKWFLTNAGAPVSVEPKSHLALALEGALGVGTALLAAPVQHLTLIHVCKSKGDGQEGSQDSPAQADPASPASRLIQGAQAGLLLTSLRQQSKEKQNFMLFFQVPAGTVSVVSASEVLVN